MSIESAQAFYSKISSDEGLLTQFQQATSQEERSLILQANGYQFTQKEWATVIAQIKATTTANSELSEAELTAVSGGVPMYGGPELFEDPFATPPTTPPLPPGVVPTNPVPMYGGPGMFGEPGITE